MTSPNSHKRVNSIDHPGISIGMPVYNGEEFIRKKLESMLAQTYSIFELIISDNASTDSTSTICQEFSKRDNRIRYIRQEKNMGAVWNYNFVLREAKYKYFAWTAVDDIILPDYLEKNIRVLESKDNVACSTSKMKMYGDMTEYLIPGRKDSFFTRLKKAIIKRFGYMDNYPAHGSYEKRLGEYFKKLRHNQILYGVYRTKQLRDATASYQSFIGGDAPITLTILKYGELHVIDEVLMFIYDGGDSRSGMINLARRYNGNLIGILFPYYPFTFWCFRNLGLKTFFKNLDFFIKVNAIAEFSLTVDLIRLLRKSIFRNKF